MLLSSSPWVEKTHGGVNLPQFEGLLSVRGVTSTPAARRAPPWHGRPQRAPCFLLPCKENRFPARVNEAPGEFSGR